MAPSYTVLQAKFHIPSQFPGPSQSRPTMTSSIQLAAIPNASSTSNDLKRMPTHHRFPMVENSFWYRSLKPLHSARISGYWYPFNSYPCGIARTGRPITLAVRLALKQSQKYPGCFWSMQKAYADRLGLASIYVVSHFSVGVGQ